MGEYLCGALRIFAFSASDGRFNAEIAEIRRGRQRSITRIAEQSSDRLSLPFARERSSRSLRRKQTAARSL